MGKEILIGKRIADIDIDGYGISMIMEDGAEFDYSASDGGYSSWDIYKRGERDE